MEDKLVSFLFRGEYMRMSEEDYHSFLESLPEYDN